MRYVNFIKVVSLFLLFSCISISFAGCNRESNDDLADKENLINQIKQDFNCTSDSGAIEFTIDGFAQSATLSAAFSVDVKIADNNFYFNEILYDSFYISNDIEISYNEDLLVSINEKITNEEVKDVIQKIQSCNNCYMLETQNANSISKKIAIYKIDDVYYFLSLNTHNQLIRIFYSIS